MERLLQEADALSESFNLQVDASGNLVYSYADIVDAIHIVQTEMGITGTTAKEAGATIAGSVSAMKAAWTNLITGLADGNADIEKLVDNLITTIVGDGTESNLGVLGNIMPAVERALNGSAKLVKSLVPQIVKMIPKLLTQNLPILAEAAVSTVESLIESVEENKDMLFQMVFDLFDYLATTAVDLLPQIVELGLSIIVSLANGIAENIPRLLPKIKDVIINIVKALTNKENLSSLLNAAISIIEALAEFLLSDEVLDDLIDCCIEIIITVAEVLAENVDKLIVAAVKIITALAEYLLDDENILKLAEAAIEVIGALATALVSAVGGLSDAAAEVIAFIVKQFTGIDLTEQGKQAISSFFKGMSMGIIGAGDFGGIGSAIAGQVPNLQVDGSHRNGLDYVPYDGYIAELHKGEKVLTAPEARGYGGTSIGNITIHIDGAKYSDEQSLASAIALEIQNMTDRRAAVYA